MDKLAHNFNHIVMLIGLVFFSVVGIYLLIGGIKKNKKDCSNGEHKPSRHVLGTKCVFCGKEKKYWKRFEKDEELRRNMFK